MPRNPSVINGKIFDVNGIVVADATLTLTHTSGTLSVTSISNGEYEFNLGNLPSHGWDERDTISISANKSTKGRKTVTTTAKTGGETLNITLEETSDLIPHETELNQRVQNFAILSGFDGSKHTNSFPVPITIRDSGTQLIGIPRDFGLEIARGNVSGMSFIHKFGRNPDIDQTREDIWNGGGTYTGFPTGAAETMEIFSSDGNDTAGGTGAQTVRIEFLLDGGFNQKPNVTVNLNGATPVSLGSQKYSRASRIIVTKAGAGGVNAGTLTLRHTTTTANIFAVMPIGYNATMIAAHTIPVGKRGYMTQWFASISKKTAGFSDVRLTFRPINEVFQVKEEFAIATTGSSYVLRNYEIPKNGIPAKTDIKISSDSSANDMGIAAGFDLILIDN